MTRDEQRVILANAIAAVIYGAKWDELVEKDHWITLGLKILDSQNGLARICSVEATEVMMGTGQDVVEEGGSLGQIWHAMSTSGDLTNHPKEWRKPVIEEL